MAWDVHLHVCFACDENDAVAGLAATHLSRDIAMARECPWAADFLIAVADRRGGNPGQKGGLLLWGIVGNYVIVDEFVERLRPFFLDLLRGVPSGPLDHEHILVFSEQEQSEQTIAHEIVYDRDTDTLTVNVHECPFSFGQY